jgi:hypothetical protein
MISADVFIHGFWHVVVCHLRETKKILMRDKNILIMASRASAQPFRIDRLFRFVRHLWNILPRIGHNV